MSSSSNKFSSFFRRVPLQDKINFARHLSLVIKAGLPILEGLPMIKKQTGSKVLSSVIDSLIVDVSNGQFLASSLERFPNIFDSFFVNVIRVGEASGTLANNLSYLSDELKKSQDLKNKIRSAMVYPIIVMVATIVLTSFLIFSVFPKILPIFASLHIKLPVSTKILIAVSQFLLANGLYVLIGLIVFLIAFRLSLLWRPMHKAFDRFILFLPVISRLTIDINAANFSRILGLLLKGGIKIVEAVGITGQTFNSLAYKDSMIGAAEEIKRGGRLSHFLSSERKIFPPLFSGLIALGESTGNLEDNLAFLSEYYKDEAEIKIHNLTTLIEPLLLLTMGLVVGFVAISIITPIYQITQGIGAQP